MMKPNIWAYADSKTSEVYTGKFATRDEAITAGFEDHADSDSIAVAEGRYPDPAGMLTGAMLSMNASRYLIDTLLERLDEFAMGNAWWSAEEPLFDLCGKQDDAEAALIEALLPWVEKWIEPQFYTAAHPETIQRSSAPHKAAESDREEVVV
jgi:hypothetical protein